MRRQFYLDLAASGLSMPIASHLVLHQRPDPASARLDGAELGRVIADTARRYNTPLAFPLMDLQIEKEDLLTILDIPQDQIEGFHFDQDGPSSEQLATARTGIESAPPTPKMRASAEAIAHVATIEGLLPMGMCIGPFSLFTKLFSDPITQLYTAIEGDQDDAQAIAQTLELATRVILRSLRQQIDAGAKAICVCEPACNLVYISPNQLAGNPDTLETYCIQYNRRIKALLDQRGVDLVFHDCGELSEPFIRAFTTLDPAILSLGSPVKLWEVAAFVPKSTVLFGNIPSKKFYSDSEYSLDHLAADSAHLRERMAATGHPFILASECDVLCVHGHEEAILSKADALAQRP